MRNFFRFYFIFSLIVVVFSCSEDDSPEESEIREGGDVFTSQLVSINVNGSLQNEYSATLGGFDIDLIKTTANELVFLVPALIEPGNTSLRIPNLNDLQINYNIRSTVLLNSPEDTVNEMLARTDIFVNGLEESDANDITPVRSSFSEVFDTLTDSEKEQAALFYTANSLLINEILESADFSRQTNPNLSRSLNISDSSLILKFKVSGVAVTAGVALAILGVEPIERGIGAMVAIVALKKFNQYLTEINSRNLKIFSAKVDGISAALERNANSDGIEFSDGQEKTLTFEVERRDFLSSDTEEGAEGVIDFINSFDLVNTAITKLNQVITFVNDNLFLSNIPLVDNLTPNDSTLETMEVNANDYEGFEFSVTDPNIEITAVGFMDGELKLTLSIINENLVENGVVNTNLRYTYNDDFNSIAGSFDISVLTTVNIFGTWTITAGDCDGTGIDYTGSLTLNTDFTVIQEDDSGGNYITNYFTFENNVLFIKTEYMDPTCNGTESRFQSDTVTLNYNSITDSFSGTGNTTKEGIDVPGCQNPPYNCNYNVSLSR